MQTVFKILFFKFQKDDIINFTKRDFIIGLIGTWLVGIGRYWDDPGASLLQHLGLGSVIYIFCLSLFIWLIIAPFRIKHWTYFRLLTFVSLTSFPAIFYAIPVERFFTIEIANTVNVWFLAIVAVWRLLLLLKFIKRFTMLSSLNITVVTLLPMCLIISVLTVLNLHRVVFNIMGGVRNPTPHDGAYLVLLFLTSISLILVIPLLVLYGVGLYNHRKNK